MTAVHFDPKRWGLTPTRMRVPVSGTFRKRATIARLRGDDAGIRKPGNHTPTPKWPAGASPDMGANPLRRGVAR